MNRTALILFLFVGLAKSAPNVPFIVELGTDQQKQSQKLVEKAIQNQKAYFLSIISGFFRQLKPTMWGDCHDFSELWNDYLAILKRKDLIDRRFSDTMLRNFAVVLSKYPRLSILRNLPFNFVKSKLIKHFIDEIQNIRAGLEEQEKVSLWAELQTEQFTSILNNVSIELDAINKIRKGIYLKKRGDFVRHILFSLKQFLETKGAYMDVKLTEFTVKRYFNTINFLRWINQAEKNFLVELFTERLRLVHNWRKVIQSLEDLIATAENQDSLAKFFESLESSAQHLQFDQLQRMIELELSRNEFDSAQLMFIEQYFRNYRIANPLSPVAAVKDLRRVYYPEFVIEKQLFDAYCNFIGNYGYGIDNDSQPASNFYFDELVHHKLVNEGDIQRMKSSIAEANEIASTTELSFYNPETISKVFKTLGFEKRIDVVIFPTKFTNERSLKEVNLFKPKVSPQIVKIIPSADYPKIISFQIPPVPRTLKQFFKNPEFMTRSYYGIMEQLLTINKDFMVVGRRIPKVFFEKFVEFPGIVSKKAIHIHLETMVRAIRPYTKITGLFRLNKVLQSYAETLKFPPTENRYFVRFFLRVIMKSYRDRRQVKLCIVLSKLRDKEPIIVRPDRHNQIQAGIILQKPMLTTQKNIKTNIFGRYSDGNLKSLMREYNVRHVLHLNQLLTQKRTAFKLCTLLQKIQDRSTPIKNQIIMLTNAINTYALPKAISKQLNFVLLGRGKDQNLEQGSSEMALKYLKTITTYMNLRTQGKLCAIFQKILDKEVKPNEIMLELKNAIVHPFINIQRSTNRNHLALGKLQTEQLPKPALKAITKFQHTLIIDLFKTLKKDIGVAFSKLKDKVIILPPILSSISASLDSLPAQTLRIKLAGLLSLGRGQDVEKPFRSQKIQLSVAQLFRAELMKTFEQKLSLGLSKMKDRLINLKEMTYIIQQSLATAIDTISRLQIQSKLFLAKGTDIPLIPQSIKPRYNHVLSVLQKIEGEIKQKYGFLLAKLADKKVVIHGLKDAVSGNSDHKTDAVQRSKAVLPFMFGRQKESEIMEGRKISELREVLTILDNIKSSIHQDFQLKFIRMKDKIDPPITTIHSIKQSLKSIPIEKQEILLKFLLGLGKGKDTIPQKKASTFFNNKQFTSKSRIVDDLKKKIDLALAKIRDKRLNIALVTFLAHRAMMIERAKNGRSSVSKSLLILGKLRDPKLLPSPARSYHQSFLIINPPIRRRIESKVHSLLSKLRDKPPLISHLTQKIQSYTSHIIKQNQKTSSNQLLMLGHYKETGKLILKQDSWLKTQLKSILAVKAPIKNQLGLLIAKMHDNKLGLTTIYMKAQQAWLTNNQKYLAKATSHSTFMERITDKEILNPVYSLAIVGCFERFYHDLKFNSWTDLHNAMRAYLEAIRDLESANTNNLFIKQALIHLKPFYKSGNLDYARFFMNFKGHIKVELQSSYQGETLAQAIGKQKFDCEKAYLIFGQLIELSHDLLPSFLGENARKLLREVRKQAVECTSDFSVASVLMKFESRAKSEESIRLQLHNLRELLSVTLSDVLELKELSNKFIKIASTQVSELALFFERNHMLLLRVYGQSLMNDVQFLFKTLADAHMDTSLKAIDLLGLNEQEVNEQLKAFFSENETVQRQILNAIIIVRTIFIRLRKTALKTIPFSYYTFDDQLKQNMAFCNRQSTKIQLLTSRIREKPFWIRTQVDLLGKAMEQIASKGSLETRQFSALSMRTFDHLLRPFIVKTMMAAYLKYLGDIRFRDYKHHFKGVFARFVSTFVRSKILTKEEGVALTKIIGDRQYFRDHTYQIRDVLIRFADNDLKAKLKKKASGSASLSTRFNVHKKTKKSSKKKHIIGRLRDHGLYHALELAKLRGKLSDLFVGAGANTQVTNLISRLQRLRLRYFDKSVNDFVVAKHHIGSDLVFDHSKRARIFYRTFNKIIAQEDKSKQSFISNVVALVKTALKQQSKKLAFRKSLYKGLTDQLQKAVKFYKNEVGAFGSGQRASQMSSKRRMFKYLQNDLMSSVCSLSTTSAIGLKQTLDKSKSMRHRSFKHYLNQQEVKQELQSLRNAGTKISSTERRKSIKKQRFKHISDSTSKSLALRSFPTRIGTGKSQFSKSFRRRKFKFVIDGLKKQLGFMTISGRAEKGIKMNKQLSFRKKFFKRVDETSSIKLKFLKHLLAPNVSEKVLNTGALKRYFLKYVEENKAIKLKYQTFIKDKLMHSIFLSKIWHNKRYRMKADGLLRAEDLFLRFGKNKRLFTASELKKVTLLGSQRMKIKELDSLMSDTLLVRRNKQGGSSLLKTSSALRDFQRAYVTKGLSGKRVGLDYGILTFVKIAKRIIKKMKKSVEFGAIKLPDNDRKVTQKVKIFCCGCACNTCLTDEMCLTGAGLEECLEHQKRVNQDVSFIVRAASMVNIDPKLNFFINVKKEEGGYREMTVLRFGEKDLNKDFLESTSIARSEMNH